MLMKKERLTGGEMVAKYLKHQGVPYATGIPGHGCLGLVDAFKKHEIPILQVRHEQSAAHLADGFFRVTGQPLVAFTSIGPGGCNTVIGVATAFVDSTNGDFELFFLPENSYQVVVTDTLDKTSVRNDVIVVAGQRTDIGPVTLE